MTYEEMNLNVSLSELRDIVIKSWPSQQPPLDHDRLATMSAEYLKGCIQMMRYEEWVDQGRKDLSNPADLGLFKFLDWRFREYDKKYPNERDSVKFCVYIDECFASYRRHRPEASCGVL